MRAYFAVGFATVILGALSARSAPASSFRALTPSYATTDFPAGTRVIASGTAVYEGAPDIDDSSALIQTFVSDTETGEDGGWGQGKNYFGPFYTGQTINCLGLPCAGQKYVPRRPCGAPQVFYRGRNAVEIYHQYFPEFSEAYGQTRQPTCILSDPPPPPCEGSRSAVLDVLPVSKAGVVLRLPLMSAPVNTLREARDGFAYVMDGWVLVDQEGPSSEIGPGLETIAASSPALAPEVGSYLGSVLDQRASARDSEGSAFVPTLPKSFFDSEAGSRYLVVVSSDHERNERWIPRPALRLSERLFQGSTEPARVVVRADYGESRQRISFVVIDSTRSLGSQEVEGLESALEIEYFSEKRHRTVVYAVLTIEPSSAGSRVGLEQGIVVLPECCCQGPCCWQYVQGDQPAGITPEMCPPPGGQLVHIH